MCEGARKGRQIRRRRERWIGNGGIYGLENFSGEGHVYQAQHLVALSYNVSSLCLWNLQQVIDEPVPYSRVYDVSSYHVIGEEYKPKVERREVEDACCVAGL